MTWDTTDLASYNDIILQDGVFAYNFTASGAIYKGQAVTPCPAKDGYVMVCDEDAGHADAIGVATGDATAGKQVPVAGPGNICWTCVDAAEVAGTPLYGDNYGILDAAAGNAKKIAGYAMNTGAAGTTNYIIKVLLV